MNNKYCKYVKIDNIFLLIWLGWNCVVYWFYKMFYLFLVFIVGVVVFLFEMIKVWIKNIIKKEFIFVLEKVMI